MGFHTYSRGNSRGNCRPCKGVMDIFLPEVALLPSRYKPAPSAKLDGGGELYHSIFSGACQALHVLIFPALTGKTAKSRLGSEILLVRRGRFR